MVMTDVYLYMLIGGGALTILSFIFGDFVEGILDGMFHPILIFGGITILGVSGISVSSQTELSAALIFFISILIAIIAYISMYFIVILPMSRAESSITLTLQDMKGMEAEIITPIPEHGYGEITVSMVSGIKSLAAKSANGQPIDRNTPVFIHDVIEDDVYVLPMRRHN